MSQAHHPLGASGAHRWVRCPASVRLSSGVEDARDQQYAELGTAAHQVAADLLRSFSYLGHAGVPNPWGAGVHAPGIAYDAALEKIAEALSPWRSDLGLDDYEALASYVQEVRDPALVRMVFGLGPEVRLVLRRDWIERRVSLSRWIPGAFSTLDYAAEWSAGDDRYLVVHDLKFGQGVRVSAYDLDDPLDTGNEQLRIYAGGLLDEIELDREFTRLALVVHQPRLSWKSYDTLTERSLREFMAWIAQRAALTRSPLAEAVPGLVQCRWCSAAGVCEARARALVSLVYNLPESAPDPRTLTPEELPQYVARIPELHQWLARLEEYAKAQAAERKLPGYKLVAGRSIRGWADPEKPAAVLSTHYPEEDFYAHVPRSPAQLEKLLGRRRFRELLKEYVARPPGSPTLVPDSDPREEYSETLANLFPSTED